MLRLVLHVADRPGLRIANRLSQHREGEGSKFCNKYGVNRLVYAEHFEDIRNAIHREKRLKKWNRRWKIDLIERENPEWHGLFGRLGWE